MVSIQDAFVDAWRSYRIKQGDAPASLPDPLGRKVTTSKSRSAKQRRAKSSKEEAVKAPGGFSVDESDAGGFIVDDEDVGDHSLSDDGEIGEEVQASPQHIPLSSIPDALASLSLPTNDTFVLDLFTQTAVYLNDDARRRRRPVGDAEANATTEKMVSLGDFSRVANVLLEGNEDKIESSLSLSEEDAPVSAIESDQEESGLRKGRRRPVRAAAFSANKRRRNQIMEEQQDELDIASEDEDVYSDASREEEEDAIREQGKAKRNINSSTSKRKNDVTSVKPSALGGTRRKRASKVQKADTTATDENEEEEEEEEGHLNATQRRTVHAAFRLFIEKLRDTRKEPLDDHPRLGKDDLKLLVKSVGEKIADKEIDEMIDEGARFFAKASSKDVTRQTAKLRRDAAAGRASARGQTNRAVTVGIDEFGGILLQGRMI